MPAMVEVSTKFVETGWTTEVNYDAINTAPCFELQRGDDVEFGMRCVWTMMSPTTIPRINQWFAARASSSCWGFYLRRGGQTYDLYVYQSESIINDIIDQFEKYPAFLKFMNSLPWRMQEHDEDITLEQGSVFDK